MPNWINQAIHAEKYILKSIRTVSTNLRAKGKPVGCIS
jgi:hypothetical protein